MLEALARARKPVILSTGMSTVREIDAPTTLFRARRVPHALLHCVSSYPATFEGLRLRAMASLRRRYRVPVGLSDHTPGVEASVAAVALGASIIEKHFTLDRCLPGADHAMSLEPSELGSLVRSIRNVEAALQGESIGFIGPEEGIRATARRSIVARVSIRKGQTIRAGMLAVRRPANGLDPRMWCEVVGSKAARDIPVNAPLTEKDLAG
jgi:sialic acid synthase SpsE